MGQTLLLEALGKGFTVPVSDFWADTQLCWAQTVFVEPSPEPGVLYLLHMCHFQGVGAA